MFDIAGKVVVMTGGAGVLGTTICRRLGERGAHVAVLDLAEDRAAALAGEINDAGGKAVGIATDVLNPESIEAAAAQVDAEFGRIDVLINGAGGNKPQATTAPDRSFFDVPADALQWVFNLNFLGTLLPSQVFGKRMVSQNSGNIINISSMTALRPLTRVVAYGGAKAAVSNFTQWLAVHMAQEYNTDIRVNAIAPGFFLTEQNRFLLTDANSGGYTERGQKVIDHTPMARFGDPEELVGTLVWLISDASRFVTGITVPIDGGFSAFSGV